MTARTGAQRRTLPLWAKALIFAASYVLAAEFGNLLSIQNAFATFWPPAGLFVAVLLISEPAEWPVLLVAGFASNLVSDLLLGRSILVGLGYSGGQTLEAVAAAALLARLIGMRPRLDTLRQAALFASVGAMLAPIVGASAGAAVALVSVPGAEWWATWYTWYIGDVIGTMLVGGVILTAVSRWDAYRLRPMEVWRTTLRPLLWSLLVAVPFSVLSYLVFLPSGGGTPWKFLVMPGIVMCAIVGGPLGAAAGLLLIALAGIGGMVVGAPAVALAAPIDAVHLFQAQAFFVVVGITTLALAGVVEEDRVHAAEAREASERFRLLFETMREGVSYCRMIFDRDGRPVDWVYLQVNDAFEAITGLHDVVGKHVWELLPGLAESNPELYEIYGETAATGRPAVFETSGRVVGRTLHISVTSPALGDFAVVLEDVTERVAEEQLLEENNERLRRMVYDVVEAMGVVAEARDPYTQGHENRVADLARLIAREIGLSEDEVEGIGMAGLLHDIGKLRIPAEILTKPGKLSAPEWSLIKEHPRQGYEILRGISFPWPVADTVLRHHERLDGSGYPDGLTGDEIPLAARILAVADVVEAMSSHRPYRPLVGLREAIEEVSGNLDRYDASVVKACVDLYERGEAGL